MRLREGWLASAVGAVREVESCAEVARPERVASTPVVRAAPLDLTCSVHCERARSREPPFVARALEQGQKCVSVPRCAVAEICALSQGPSTPGQLAARGRKLLVEHVGER